MKERDVQDDKTSWKCVEAFSALGEEGVRKAEEITGGNGKVDVVCTPSGGAQTVRLSLQKEWHETMSDEELKTLIKKSQG